MGDATVPEEKQATGVLDEILEERMRQIEAEGYGWDHDDEHHPGEMAQAARCYASSAGLQLRGAGEYSEEVIRSAVELPPQEWPWQPKEWKPKGPRRDMIRAAALLVAEIERLDRAEAIPELEPEPPDPNEGFEECQQCMGVGTCNGETECGWCGGTGKVRS